MVFRCAVRRLQRAEPNLLNRFESWLNRLRGLAVDGVDKVLRTERVDKVPSPNKAEVEQVGNALA
jgi:hypothetical protein